MIQPSKWLDVQTNQKLSQFTKSQLMTLCDLKNDDYHKLVLAEIPKDSKSKSKLKVFKGIGMVSEQSLPEIPTSLVSFYTEESEPKTPIIAASIGPSVLFYRNMKPYYKYTLPSMPIQQLEQDIWRKLPIERPENQENLIESLETIETTQLSGKSQKLLQLPHSKRDDFIKQNADVELQRISDITIMATLQRTTSTDTKPPSCLVLATENGDIVIIDTQVFTVIYQARVCSFEVVPTMISVTGQFDTDFRMVISTHDDSLFLLRKSWLEGREILQSDYTILNMTLLPVDQTIVITTTDKDLTCFSKKGKVLWSVELETMPVCMVPVGLPHLGLTLLCVALENQKVQFYSQKSLVDEIKVKENVLSMIFGRLGQEEHVLALVTTEGNILVKILKRTAEFGVKLRENENKKADENRKKLKIPSLSAIFSQQNLRDQDNSNSIYNSFQVELWRLRLTAARSTVEAINSTESTFSGDMGHAQIKLAAQICGLGPKFRLFLTIENMSDRKDASNLTVLLHADNCHYSLPKAIAKLPILVPGVPIKIDFDVIAVLDRTNGMPPPNLTEDNSIVRVMVIKTGQAKPLIAAVVVMPASEAPLEM